MASHDFSRTLNSAGHSSGFARSKAWFHHIHLDLPLLLLLLTLCCGSLLVLYSASGRNFAMVERQALHFLLGFVALFVCAQFPPRFYSKISLAVYLLSIATLMAVIAFGVHSKGAQRWLEIPGLPRFQPSELAKLALPLALAWYLSKCPSPPKFRHIVVAAILLIVPVLLIFKQPDLGTALLVLFTGICVIFLAGMSWPLIITLGLFCAAIAPVLWLFVLHEYQKQRVLTFLSPESDPLGAGWNIIQSKIAIGSGGLQGKGWLMGSQSHLEFLPESHTDFIIAVLAEEFGFIGVLFLLTFYALIVLRCLYLSVQCETLFGRLLSGCLAITFFIYVFVNIGMVSGILPVVGVPLPLVSYGGTSVISLLAAFGVLMSMSTHNRN